MFHDRVAHMAMTERLRLTINGLDFVVQDIKKSRSSNFEARFIAWLVIKLREAKFPVEQAEDGRLKVLAGLLSQVRRVDLGSHVVEYIWFEVRHLSQRYVGTKQRGWARYLEPETGHVGWRMWRVIGDVVRSMETVVSFDTLIKDDDPTNHFVALNLRRARRQFKHEVSMYLPEVTLEMLVQALENYLLATTNMDPYETDEITDDVKGRCAHGEKFNDVVRSLGYDPVAIKIYVL
jgi:hypothetical protein